MPPAATSPSYTPPADPGLARRLNVFDATMLVMGGIVGAGIFVSPHVVARHVQSPGLILAAWAVGGVIALIGAFVYAELAALRPAVGGVYAYLRDAFGPLSAFLYGWTLLLVVQSGGMAAVSVTFARYFNELVGVAAPEQAIAVAVLALLTAINWAGVRTGSNVQSTLMLLKIVAILGVVIIGSLAGDVRGGRGAEGGAMDAIPPVSGVPPTPSAFLAALVPVLFAYGGWQTASFIAGELKDPRRDLPRGLLVGISGVIVLYVAVNAVCLRALGPAGLAATPAPASAVVRGALGDTGARLIAAAIAISTIGFLSQSMLTAPRVYYAMARDGVFFKRVGSLDPRTRAPAAAIALQGTVAAILAFLPYGRILNYVVAIDAVFFGLTGASLLVFRRRERDRGSIPGIRTPGHPVTTAIFVAAFWILALSTVYQFPRDAGVGVLILMAGVPVYLFWRRP